MPPGIIEEPVDFKFVINFAENYVTIVLAINRTSFQLRIGIY
jgi:hypothetical protein